ncbi:MAG: choice-of-anchor J domain-containing protein, partial [Bacteroidales bacterium]|nr:choice-of-anchor J domain-containing protein [Bacteroidales bacterium]
PGKANAGSKCAATVLAGNYPANANTRLIRHTSFTIPSADQNPRLRFWHWYYIFSGDQGIVQIKVGSGDWQTISEIYNHSSSGVWSYPSIDLKAYAGLTVQLAFYFTSNSDGYIGSGWYIDDIAIITGPIIFNNPETWELGLGDWYADRGTWEVGTPTSGPGNAYNGTKCAATVLNGNYSANISSRLISPSFTIPSADQNPALRFWHWYSIYSGDAGTVQIKTADSEWQTILGPLSNTSGGVWSPVYIDLSLYANKKAQIAFYFTSNSDGNNSSGWYVDEINFDKVTEINENVFKKINIYPNPFSDKAIIEFNDMDLSNYRLSVYNISGNKVLELGKFSSDKIELEKGNLPAGIYIIELRGDKVFRNKIIIK